MKFPPNEPMLELVREVRTAGLATAILTNNVREFRPMWWPAAPWDELFDVIVDSSEEGVRKPDPAIYRLTLDRLGVGATRAAFLDDVESNVRAAESLGMHGIVVDDDTHGAASRLRELAGLARRTAG